LGIPQDAAGSNLTAAGTVTLSYAGDSLTTSVAPYTGAIQ